MPNDWSEFQAFIDSQAKPATEAQVRHLRISHTIAQQMEEILRDDPWETFKGHVHVLNTVDQETLDATLTRYETAVGTERDTAQLEIQRLRGRIEGRAQVLALPAGLVAQTGAETP